MNQALRTGLIVVAAIVAIGLYASVFVVGQMQQALVLQFGRVRAVLNATGEDKPGLYFKIPFAETVVVFDKRVLDLDLPVQTILTADRQNLEVDAFARYRILDPLRFYQSVGNVGIANQRLQAIQQGAQLAAQARQYSSRPTAASGGDAGWVTPGELDPAVAAALADMRPGQISRPIPVTGGAYLIFLREKRAGGGEPVVALKQAAINVAADAPADQVQAAQTALLSIKAKNPTCATLEAAAAGVAGVEVGDLGEAEVKDLTASFRTAIENLQPGQISNPVRTNIGLHLVAVCSRRTSGQNIPSRDELHNRLMAQQIDMLQRRELRDLRAAATISQPQ